MRIEYHPKIANEIEEIRDYYNRYVDGLGDEFVDEFERRVQAISEMPERWMVVHNGIRRSLMHRFPYSIYHRILRQDFLRVIVVKHQRRHPKWGLHRK
jgi:plasmid stabilization system protein ParE